jgi:hypothetical protein
VDSRLTPAAIRAALLAGRNPDGGWPYYPQHASRLEPTVWALLALARDADRPAEIDIIVRWPSRDGWLVDGPADAPVNYPFNALAALACVDRLDRPGTAPLVTTIAKHLIDVRGLALEQNDVQRQNNALQAWPWIDQTFSWVEPTAWCTLFLKKIRKLAIPGAAERIATAERLVRDRVCRDGGWNYGSSNVYGQELYPYVPTTAITLLAMQDQRADPVVVKSLKYLESNLTSERTSVALSLSAICFAIYGLPIDAIGRALAGPAEVSRVRDNVLGLAMSLYAVSENPHAMAAFAL